MPSVSCARSFESIRHRAKRYLTDGGGVPLRDSVKNARSASCACQVRGNSATKGVGGSSPSGAKRASPKVSGAHSHIRAQEEY